MGGYSALEIVLGRGHNDGPPETPQEDRCDLDNEAESSAEEVRCEDKGTPGHDTGGGEEEEEEEEEEDQEDNRGEQEEESRGEQEASADVRGEEEETEPKQLSLQNEQNPPEQSDGESEPEQASSDATTAPRRRADG